MNAKELNEWVKFHTAAFPGLSGWLDQHAETLELWMDTMSDVDLNCAKAATKAMHAGDLAEPNGYSKHPAAIRRHARDVAYRSANPLEYTNENRRYVDGEEVFICHLCHDGGTIDVIHPKTQRQARQGDDSINWRTCCVPCQCSSGDRWRHYTTAGGKRISMPTYDDSRMFRVTGRIISNSEKSGYMDWLGRDAERAANYEPAFGEF